MFQERRITPCAWYHLGSLGNWSVIDFGGKKLVVMKSLGVSIKECLYSLILVLHGRHWVDAQEECQIHSGQGDYKWMITRGRSVIMTLGIPRVFVGSLSGDQVHRYIVRTFWLNEGKVKFKCWLTCYSLLTICYIYKWFMKLFRTWGLIYMREGKKWCIWCVDSR